MNGGKDVKFGDDKRPVSIVPSNEQNLYNISNGELLTDEFGNPLITEVDTYYLPDATAKRSTSVVVPTKESAFSRPIYVSRGSATVQYADLDVHVLTNVLRRSGSPNPVSIGLTCVQIGGSVLSVGITSAIPESGVGTAYHRNLQTTSSGNGTGAKFFVIRDGGGVVTNIGIETGSSGNLYAANDTITIPSVSVGSTQNITLSVTSTTPIPNLVNLDQYPNFEVRVRNSLNNRKDELYGDIPAAVSVGDYVSGPFITPGTFVSEIAYNNTRLYMSENYSATENYVGVVSFFTAARIVNKHNPTLKVEEQFKESSEVSNTLLGVNRAEVQLSLFSNVSSYGLDPDEFETFSWTSGVSFGTWDARYSKRYGENRYNTRESEET